MIDIIITVILMISSYLIGSIPFALLMGKINGVDIREYGSKNIGTTNAIRVLGKPKGLLAFVFEVLKGAFAIIVAKILISLDLYDFPIEINGVDLILIVGIPAVLGHVFPIYLKFKGGKAVATSLGLVLSLTPIPGLLCLVAFLIVLYTTGYVSLASTAAALTVLISTLILESNDVVLCVLYALLCLLIFYKHKANYIRLFKGTENNFKKKKNNNNQDEEN